MIASRSNTRTLAIELRDSRGLKSYQIFVNGVPLFSAGGRPVAGKKARFSHEVELTHGDSGASCVRPFRTGTSTDYTDYTDWGLG